MQKLKLSLGIGVILILLGGFAFIVYKGMPVRQMENQFVSQQDSSVQNQAQAETDTQTVTLTYSMQEVQSHASENDCWSAINGKVYDLSSWVSRHPGGSITIVSLCGTDGSKAFNAQHGRSNRAQSALALLKIGSLI